MKQLIRKSMAISSLLFALPIALLSFSSPKGGEGFEIFLDSKLVLQQFGKELTTVKSIRLERSISNSQISVRYFHCGQTGKNRSITIRNANNKILKEWRFADASASSLASKDPSMNFKVADILGLQKNNPGQFGLYYSSDQLPKGRQLATLVVN
jgi:hypothetical protein